MFVFTKLKRRIFKKINKANEGFIKVKARNNYHRQ